MWGRLSLTYYQSSKSASSSDCTDESSKGIILNSDRISTDKSVPISFPFLIDLDISKSQHFVGRLPNPDESKFQHKMQHAIPVSFFSATHFGISRKCTTESSSSTVNDTTSDNSNNNNDVPKVKYILTDYSTNGTYLKPSNGTVISTIDTNALENLKPVGYSKSVEINDNDVIIFKFKGQNTFCYTFHSLYCLPEVFDGITTSKLSTLNSSLQQQPQQPIDSSQQNSMNNNIYDIQILNLKNEIRNLEDRVSNYTRTVENLQKENMSYTRDITLLKDKNSLLTKELKKINEDYHDLENNLTAIEANNRKLKDFNDDANDRITELLNKINILNNEIMYKTDQVESRDSIMRELTQAKADEVNKRKDVQKKYDSAVYLLEIEKSRNVRLTDANTLLQSIAGDRETEIENHKVCLIGIDKFNGLTDR